MRTKKAVLNSSFGLLSYFVIMLASLITRRVLVDTLGLEVVGLDSFLKSLISMLALAELGIGSGLLYKLYQPIADENIKLIEAILNFYKKAYLVISVIIVGSGALLSAFLGLIVKENYSKTFVLLVFLLYLADTLSTYLFAHKKALIIADQKNYIINLANLITQLLMCALQVFVLYFFKSFILFIFVRLFLNTALSFSVSLIFRKLYPKIDLSKSKEELSLNERKELFSNIKAMFLHKIGTFSGNSSASIIISSMLGIFINGIYSNYTLITQTLIAVISQIYDGISASFGNLLTRESNAVIIENFNTLYFLNYLISSFCSVSFLVIVQPFITLWVGEKSLFSFNTAILFALHLYFTTMRKTILMVKDNAGLYKPDRYFTLLETLLNIGLSLVFVTPFGVNGVIGANILSFLLVPLWTQTFIVYKHILQIPPINYYFKYIVYLLVSLVSCIISLYLANIIRQDNIVATLLIRTIICIVVPNLINLLVFSKTKEFVQLKNKIITVIKR